MFELRIPTEELQVRGPLFAAGQAWLRLGEVDFPEHGWTDLPLSVFGSLHHAAGQVSRGETCDAYFFEGSYFVKLIPAASIPGAGRLVRIVGLYDGDAEFPEGGAEIRADIMLPLKAVSRNLNAVLCTLRTWATADGDAESAAMLGQMAFLPEH